jgi:hypothetical protein
VLLGFRRVSASPTPGAPANALSRRQLVRRGLVGGLVLFFGGTLPIALRSGIARRPPRRPLAALTPTEHAVFAAVAARIVPGDPERAGARGDGSARWPEAAELEVAEKVDGVLATLHPRAAADFRRLLHVFENGVTGLVTIGVPVTFTRCAPETQDRRLEAWRHSRIALFRSGYQAMKRLALAVYHAAPETYALVGYPGPPVVPQVPS